MKNIILLISIITVFTIGTVNAEIWEVGVPSLMMDSYGARLMALGDTFTGIADDINTISVNPAGLNTLDSTEVSLMYLSYPLDMSFMYGAGGTPLPGSLGYIAASLTLFSVSDFDEIDLVGNKTGTSLSAGDLLINVGYANNLLKLLGMKQNLNAGINLKFVNSKLVDESSTAFGFDIGFLYKMNMAGFGGRKLSDNLGIGLAIQNLGTSLNYGNEDTFLPRNIRIGAGYKGFKNEKHDITFGFDINMPNDSDMIPGIGLEYSYLEMLFGRIGYKIAGREADHFSFGLGGKYNFSGKPVSFDYALIPLSDIGVMHSFSLSMNFGSASEKGKPKTEETAAPSKTIETIKPEEDATPDIREEKTEEEYPSIIEEDTAPTIREEKTEEEDPSIIEKDAAPDIREEKTEEEDEMKVEDDSTTLE